MRLKESLVVVKKMPPRRGAHRGDRGGRGRGVGRVQPKVQPVAQATDPTAPVTHAELAAMEQRFRDLIMQMREHSSLRRQLLLWLQLYPRACRTSCWQRPNT
ncbi:gag protease polyprotein [Cucumis melo var. makuwa]|uniref:Gag protease polyprotein n=1 Tax=Cucumis melo var. makuwa TaxID=1194695 RepID=A0A5A7V1A7_CUCMM|nr:gag protease polyprotein [Cucumis melo var. makuwa]